ncbi:MAG: acyltransferase [Carboxylicivirga sp.]|jgi:acetyltransferase-like isoleucine patch superfamily enzyme|nr:acyltransferase [Carboxylicivirga sp.]
MSKLNKIKQQYASFGMLSLLRWLFYKLFLEVDTRRKRIKSLYYFKRSDVRIGKNVTFKGISNNINIGDDFVIYNNCIFEFGLNAKITIGHSCLFSYGVLIQNTNNISIGDYVQVGEYTSIRDTSHRSVDANIPIKKQGDISDSIVIGSNIWIGKACIILPGTVIDDGVIIGANSVVKGHLKKNCVYAGAPLRFIKERK